MRSQKGARRVPGAAATLVMSLAASSSAARPFTIDDFLGREDLGAIEQAGQRLVIERRGPATSAARYDLDALQDIERTKLWVADLTQPGPPRLLFPADRTAGYALGAASPDGRRVAVMRLTARHWELGVADPLRRKVRWLGVTPEMTSNAATTVWRTNDELVVIARKTESLPRNVAYRRVYAEEAPALWRTTARGGAATRTFESGPDAARRLDQRTLVAIHIRSGHRRTLASGPFIGLILSPDHRRAAILAEGRDHPMSAAHPVQGDYGFEANERRLQLIDLHSGASIAAAARWDILLHPLAWSEDGRELIAFGRDAVVPWAEGRLLRIDGETGRAEAVRGFRASLDARPEAARAGWYGGAPIAWGMIEGATEPRWWRLPASGPLPLTVDDLGFRKDALTRTPAGLLAAGRNGIWRISQHAPPVLAAAQAKPISYPQLNRAYAFEYEIPFAERVVAREPAGGLIAVSGDRVETLPDLPHGAEVLHPSESTQGLVVRHSPRGGMLELSWSPQIGAPVTLFHLNPGLADLDPPLTRAIHHLGPDGQQLTSWLLLPRRPAGAAPPPLIVRPYPGARYPALPSTMDSWSGGPDKAAALLASHGYAVLAPSLPIAPGAEPAENLAGRVLAIIDQANADPELQGLFDADRLGVWGESFGGWGALTMITQTDRFRAAVAEASMSDLVSQWGQFETFVRLDASLGPSPFFTEGWVEDLQGGMHNPPWSDPQRYVRNSPVFHADRVTTPLLLLHGEQDAFSVGQAEEMFSALVRQNKPVEFVTYWGEGHAIASPASLRDLYARVFRLFDERLVNGAISIGHAPASPGPGTASSARTPPSRSPTSTAYSPTGR